MKSTRRELLRHVAMDAVDDTYILKVWDTFKLDSMGKSKLAYEFGVGNDTDEIDLMLFSGDDFACSPVIAIDSDECLRALLGFLLLRPGDVEKDYFDAYTDDQMSFAESGDCEELQLWLDENITDFYNCDGDNSADSDASEDDSDDGPEEDQDKENSDQDDSDDPDMESDDQDVGTPDSWSKL